MLVAGKGPGGDCWLLLQSARVEAEDVKRSIASVVRQLQKANSQYRETLQFEHRKLWELLTMKEALISSLTHCISDLAKQQISLHPDPCLPDSLLTVSSPAGRLSSLDML